MYGIYLYLTYFTQHNTLKVNPFCQKQQDKHFSHGCIILHCSNRIVYIFIYTYINIIYVQIYIYIYIHYTFIHSPTDRHQGFHSVKATVNNAMNMKVQMISSRSFLLPLDIHPEVKMVDHMVVLFLII